MPDGSSPGLLVAQACSMSKREAYSTTNGHRPGSFSFFTATVSKVHPVGATFGHLSAFSADLNLAGWSNRFKISRTPFPNSEMQGKTDEPPSHFGLAPRDYRSISRYRQSVGRSERCTRRQGAGDSPL